MVEKIKLSSIIPTTGSNLVFFEIEDEETNEIVSETPEILTLEETPLQDESDEALEIQTFSSELEEVMENSLVEGTDNIYMKEKKYILPIENLDNATYNDVQQT